MYAPHHRQEKQRAARERWERNNPERRKALRRKYALAAYGLTPEQYDVMLAEQDGRCALCLSVDPGGKHGRFNVDHDHATGVVRALLCNRCNILIGVAADDPETLGQALVYLERHGRG